MKNISKSRRNQIYTQSLKYYTDKQTIFWGGYDRSDCGVCQVLFTNLFPLKDRFPDNLLDLFSEFKLFKPERGELENNDQNPYWLRLNTPEETQNLREIVLLLCIEMTKP